VTYNTQTTGCFFSTSALLLFASPAVMVGFVVLSSSDNDILAEDKNGDQENQDELYRNE